MAGVFGLVALRATGLGFLMITLALSQVLWGTAYRWVSVTDGDNGLRGLTRPAPFGLNLDGAPAFYCFTLAIAATAIWLIARFVHSPFRAALRSRPAPAHACPRPRRVADPLDYVRLFRVLGRRRRAAVRVLQQIHTPAIAVDRHLGRSAARRDRRRRRDAGRARHRRDPDH